MKREIKRQFNKIKEEEKQLYIHILTLGNDMNECDCEKPIQYDFRNIISISEPFILCFNCGGYIEYKEEDWL